MKILNLGSMNLDYVYCVEHFPLPGETITAISQTVMPGGKGLNQSIAIQKAGAQVYHAVNRGTGSEMLIKTLEENGVNTSLINPVSDVQGSAMILVDNSGENCITLYGGSNRSLTKEQILKMLEPFGKGDFLVLQNEVNLLPYIVRSAYEKGISVILNPSPCDEKIKEIPFELLSFLFINEIEGNQLTGETEPEKILDSLEKSYPQLSAVLTLGKNGAICMHEGKRVFQPCYKVTAVDTTAAGDTFSGYFIAMYTGGRNIDECMKYAAKASSIAVTRIGAAVSIPVISEVEESFK